MSRRRQILFAAPFVVIAVGCDKPAVRPAPTASRAFDAGVARAPAPDAMAASAEIRFDGTQCLQGPPETESTVTCPPEMLPTAAAGTAVLETYGSFRARDRKLVRGPATIVAPDPDSIDKGTETISFEDDSFGCESHRHVSCPKGAKCNPPRPEVVACPDNLLPQLVAGVSPTSRKGKECLLGDVRVVCPTGDLSGPATTQIDDPTLSYRHIDFVAATQDCWGEPDFYCPPQSKCNPPAPESVPCPDELLPTLVNGKQPTKKKDGTCWWNQTRVRCD